MDVRTRWIHAGLLAATALAGVLALSGCAGQAPHRAELVAPDFTIDAVVTLPEGAPRDGSQPRSRRPARYLLQPGGELRAAFGAGVGGDTIPPLARRLTPAEIEDLWSLAEDAGLLEGTPEGRIAWGSTWDAPPTGAAAVVSVSARGRRVHVGRSLGTGMGGGLGSPATERLIDRLAELAWEPAYASVPGTSGD